MVVYLTFLKYRAALTELNGIVISLQSVALKGNYDIYRPMVVMLMTLLNI